MQKGIFVVFDGNDGSGKATQTKLLEDFLVLQGKECLRLDFPAYNRNFFGAFVGECLAGLHGDFVHMDPKIASSLYALDRLESVAQIQKALAEGKVVLADRFSSSNQIHQGGKIADDEERVAFLLWLEKMEHDVLSIPRPDAIIYLDVPVEVSLKLLAEKRAAKNQTLADGVKDTVEEDRNYLERSHETARWLSLREQNWHIVDCMGEEGLHTPEEIKADVIEIVATVTAAV